MAEVKIFKVEGEIRSPSYETVFTRYVRAQKPEHAAERVYTELGSQHRVKRVHMKIASIKEVTMEEVEDPIIRELSQG